MDDSALERIAKLEVRMGNVEDTVKGVDQKLDTIITSVTAWQNNQKGFVAGVTLIGGVLWTVVATSWDKIVKIFGGGSS